MATWFSNHYTSTGSDQSSLPTTPYYPGAGIKHARKRCSVAHATVTDGAAADIVRMCTLKSSDRVTRIMVFTDGGFDVSSSADVGLYLSGANHDGAVVDIDLFSAGVDVTSAIDAENDIFDDGALGGEDRGTTLWQCADVGGGTYSADPKVDFDLTIALTGNDTTAGELSLVVEYLAGD